MYKNSILSLWAEDGRFNYNGNLPSCIQGANSIAKNGIHPKKHIDDHIYNTKQADLYNVGGTRTNNGRDTPIHNSIRKHNQIPNDIRNFTKIELFVTHSRNISLNWY